MTGGPARSLRLLVEPHQLVHQLIDAVAGLRGKLLDGRILHRCDVSAQFVRAPRHRPSLAEQGRDHLRRRRIRLVHAVLGKPEAHFHSPAREFLQCHRANGDTKTESIRALKRRFSDVVYSALPTD